MCLLSLVYVPIMLYNLTIIIFLTVRMTVRREESISMNIKEQLDQYQIGGIGDIKRKTLRFHSYRMGTESGKLTLYAVYDLENPPKIFSGYPSGQDLLVELCNLHLELTGKSIEARANIIQRWCLSNMHPYYHFGDSVRYSQFEADKNGYWDAVVNMIETYYIHVDEMCSDLQKLYADTMTVLAIRSLLEKDEYGAKKLLSSIQPWTKNDLLQEWKDAKPELRPRLIDNYMGTFPKFTMSLQRDESTNALVLLPEVTSVIEAAYYALSRFVAVNSGALDDWGGKTSIAFCAACGSAFIKRGNRQKYCLSPQCQSIRNQRKSKDYYYRERQKEIDEMLS